MAVLVSKFPSSLRLMTHSPEGTRGIGRLLGEHASPGDIFLLTGELGAGKTCLTQGIAWGLGVEGYVRSPTFVIAVRYSGSLTVHHIDLFRIRDAREAWDLGLEEYLYGDGVCIVEWADRASDVFPMNSLWIALDYGATEMERLVEIRANEKAQGRLLEGLQLAH